jgi:hypothetical protein
VVFLFEGGWCCVQGEGVGVGKRGCEKLRKIAYTSFSSLQ